MRLTPPLNLPALGRRQPPYVVFTTLRRPVFLVNSRLGPFTATSPKRGTPFSEVTGLICRVPERVFSQAPEDSHPTYLCRFAVRSVHSYAERGFSWQLGSATLFRPEGRTFVPTFTLNAARICLSRGLWSFNRASIAGLTYPTASPHGTATGSGILTGFPSTTPFGLALGADLPRAD